MDFLRRSDHEATLTASLPLPARSGERELAAAGINPLPVTERFAVVIPALNAETSVGAVVRGCLAQLPDVVVVDDGSIDATAAMAADAGAIVLRHPRRRGKGGAMKSGFDWALTRGFDGVIGVDADGQHLPSEIPKLLRCRAESGADMVIGCRSHLFEQMLPGAPVTGFSRGPSPCRGGGHRFAVRLPFVFGAAFDVPLQRKASTWIAKSSCAQGGQN